MFGFLNKILGLDEDFFGSPAHNNAVGAGPPSTPAVQSSQKKVMEDEGFVVSRVDMIQRMWGEGFSSPGSPEYVSSLATPLNLDPQKSVLDMAAGLGGMARTLSNSYKTYITALERDEELAREGMRISSRTGHGKHAPVAHYDPLQFDFTKRVDAVIARELLYTIPDKEELITKMAAAVKPRGHMLITDFTCDDLTILDNQPGTLWKESEPYGVYLIPAARMAKILEGHGFDVRINEDMTKLYIRQILFGLTRVTRYLEGKKLAPSTKAVLKKEVDYWSRCLAVLELGIKNTRFYAIKVR